MVINNTHICVVGTYCPPPLIAKVDKVINYPDVDVAALVVGENSFEYFETGKPPDGYDDLPLGEDPLSYGSPYLV